MKKVHIYIDESELNGIRILGAIVVPDKHRYMAERRLTDLRKRMLGSMQKHGYPILNPAEAQNDKYSRQKTERARLAAGGLPEIHAAELWSSDMVFWMSRDGTPALRDRHQKWLRETLSVFASLQMTYYRNVLMPGTFKRMEENEPEVFDVIQPYLTQDIRRDKVKTLQKDPYVRLLFGLMQSLDAVAKENGWEYNIVCDRGKKNEMFKIFETFYLLKKFGSWQGLQGIDFKESHEVSLIQLCDVVTYIDTKAGCLEEGHRDKAAAMALQKRYIAPFSRPIPRQILGLSRDGFFRYPSPGYTELMAMLTEMALLHCGGMNKTLPERRRRLQEIMEQYPDIFLFNFPLPVRKP